ncbi:MAG TPA: sugar phosphate isomerase/epimerase family protein [Sedimentisphaerales bacterium]|nr:sugar phosphate isomerase/epimerase family protein [Sedimentisphaerales bacterium]
MKHYLSRREFLANSACAAAVLALGSKPKLDFEAPPERTFGKALILKKPTEEMLRKIKDAGFDGVEAGITGTAEAAKIRKIAERLDMRIHSVLRGWARFNSKNPEDLEETMASTVRALHAAAAYGADAVLLVPCQIKAQPMPEPWEFCIKFDTKTGHLTAVAEKDNDRYRDYIAAHDHAYDSSQAAIRKLIGTAEKMGVVIAVENVWNNLFVDPHHAAHFIDSFESPWVRFYFDIGNHVKYSRPQQWIAVLGKRIVKCHVKDFKLNADGHGGEFVNIREGSVDWPAVVKALKDAGYHGWMTIEGSDKLSMAERSRRLDLIIAGR